MNFALTYYFFELCQKGCPCYCAEVDLNTQAYFLVDCTLVVLLEEILVQVMNYLVLLKDFCSFQTTCKYLYTLGQDKQFASFSYMQQQQKKYLLTTTSKIRKKIVRV